jgi:lipopolysaccharide transport system ATP-binding protein
MPPKLMSTSQPPAITIEQLGKQYRLGSGHRGYRTLREVLVEVLRAPFKGLLGPGGASPRPSPAPGPDTIWALKDVSLDIPQGEIMGVIGRNGAGKTTLLKVLCRITEPNEGRVQLRGRVGSLLEVGTGFHPELTGRENIFMNGAILGMSRREIQSKFDAIVAFAEIEPFLDTPLKRYSTGMGTRLAFAVAAHLETDILLVDEVLAVGDLGFRKKCLGKMQDVTRAGRTVLFVSHDLNSVRRLCQSALWLDGGRVKAMGGVQETVRQYEASFLGPEGRQASRVERTSPPPSQKYFAWVALNNDKGDPCRTFSYGDTLRLSLGMAGKAPFKSHYIEWFITDRLQGSSVAWGSTRPWPEAEIPGDCGQITFTIGPLSLAEGEYSFFFSMGVAGVIDLDIWSDAITFEIIHSDPHQTGFYYTTNHAPVIIPYRIEIVK